MAMDFKEFTKWIENLEKLKDEQVEEFIESCCKELAARLLRKVIKRTPVGDYSGQDYSCKQKESTVSFQHKGNKNPGMHGGTLRRGWTAGKSSSASAYANSLNIVKEGNKYHIDIINPVEYASYVEYGHRKNNGQGWVPGHFMLTISENELNQLTPKILQAKLNKFIKDSFNQ